MSKSYRILGGPKHGDFAELPYGHKTLEYLVPKNWPPSFDAKADAPIETTTFQYVVATFYFPELGYGVEVLVPKGSNEMVKEAYLVNLISGRNVYGNW